MAFRSTRVLFAVSLFSLASTSIAAAQQQTAWANFDFVPGERILFADDFMRDRVGNFPQRLQLIVGNLEIVELAGKRFLRSSSDPASIRINLPETLPQRFTIEFDVLAVSIGVTVLGYTKELADLNWSDSCESAGWGDASPTAVLCFSGVSAGISGGGEKNSVRQLSKDSVFRVRIQVDGKYIKAYADEERVVNFPSADFGRGKSILINLPGTSETPALIGNIVVAAGGRSMYDALAADGRVVTQGIYFDVGSDRIRPESAPTLQLIGDMLKEHADLKLTVEGHTDNSGTAAGNQALSEKRAQAIVKSLSADFGIAGARLASKGYGASKPAAPNETAEGRQQNRRVELAKM